MKAPADEPLPWVEKYRPSNLDEVVAHEDIIATIRQYVRKGQLPHLLFHGPPGTGKTSTILAVARELYGSHLRTHVLELNASDDRGINTVREQIKTFAETTSASFKGRLLHPSVGGGSRDGGALQQRGPPQTSPSHLLPTSSSSSVTTTPHSSSFNSSAASSFSSSAAVCSPSSASSAATAAAAAALDGGTGGAAGGAAASSGKKKAGGSEKEEERRGGEKEEGEELEEEASTAGHPAAAASSFCGMAPPPLKLVILDEADQITSVAQNALRRIMEAYARNVRFCLICNYVSRIAPAIQSRCTGFRFTPLPSAALEEKAEAVARAEGVKISRDGVEALVRVARGDMRRLLNCMQASFLAHPTAILTADGVHRALGQPLPSEVERIFERLLILDFAPACRELEALVCGQGYSMKDWVAALHQEVLRTNWPVHVLVTFVGRLADIEARVAAGASEIIQMHALVAAFFEARGGLHAGPGAAGSSPRPAATP